MIRAPKRTTTVDVGDRMSEFFYAVLPYPKLNHLRMAALERIVTEMSPEVIAELHGENPDDDKTVHEIRDYLIDLVDELPAMENRLDVAFFCIGGMRGIVSGGESCGDVPTRGYGNIADLVSCSPIYDKLEEWMVGDARHEEELLEGLMNRAAAHRAAGADKKDEHVAGVVMSMSKNAREKFYDAYPEYRPNNS